MDKSPAKPVKLDVIQTPFCGDLRSKKFYLRNEIITQAEDYHDASGHTFCYNTQMQLGPDGLRAAPEYCTPDRSCYRSAFEEPPRYVPPTPVNLDTNDNLEV